jgi:hypothetical protein
MWESGGEHEYAQKQGTKNQEHDDIPATMQPTQNTNSTKRIYK